MPRNTRAFGKIIDTKNHEDGVFPGLSRPFESPVYRPATGRSVAVRSGFLVNGKVGRRIVNSVNYELPGGIGDAAKAFIATQAALRRKPADTLMTPAGTKSFYPIFAT